MDNLLTRFSSPGPKRILALDGGGIRGALTLGYLERIEAVLKKAHGNKDDFRLCQYFDLIAGTSTGSIIAACLATGMPVSRIKEIYFKLGGMIFEDVNPIWNIFKIRKALRAKFDEKKLREHLQAELKDMTLGSDKLLTGLCVTAKRADRNSTWTFNNHPSDKFGRSKIGSNLDMPLWEIVRASTAAPTYFLPQKLTFGGGDGTGMFVDGGVSTANNPSIQALMLATMKNYSFQWKTGEKNIFLLSVGTGETNFIKTEEDVEGNWLLSWATQVPDMLMRDSNFQNQLMLRWMSKTYTPKYFNMQYEFMEGEGLVAEPLLTYNRYNSLLSEENLANLGFHAPKDYKSVEHLAEMSNGENVKILFDVGRAAAESEVQAEQFPEHFNMQS